MSRRPDNQGYRRAPIFYDSKGAAHYSSFPHHSDPSFDDGEAHDFSVGPYDYAAAYPRSAPFTHLNHPPVSPVLPPPPPPAPSPPSPAQPNSPSPQRQASSLPAPQEPPFVEPAEQQVACDRCTRMRATCRRSNPTPNAPCDLCWRLNQACYPPGQERRMNVVCKACRGVNPRCDHKLAQGIGCDTCRWAGITCEPEYSNQTAAVIHRWEKHRRDAATQAEKSLGASHRFFPVSRRVGDLARVFS